MNGDRAVAATRREASTRGARRLAVLGLVGALALASPSARAQTAAPPPATRPPVSTLESVEPKATAAPAPAGPAAALASRPSGKPSKLSYRFILTGYKDNYFITGFSSAAQVKFQFSLKVDLWPNDSNHSLYFGYTQKSLWNLYAASSPFLDSNYNPEVFYGYFKRYGDVVWAPGRVTPFLDSARVGIEHESNGRDGTASRGWNRVYGYAEEGVYFGTDVYATLALKGWLPPFSADDNPDITAYRGYGEVTGVLGYDPTTPSWWGGGHLGVRYYHGWTHVLEQQGIEGFAEWRPAYQETAWRFTPNFYVQLFSGYAEYLLDYKQKDTAFRIGFSIDDRVHWVGHRG
jgi:outer membrane phospholipase A